MDAQALILIVDDNSTNIKVLSDSLKVAGYKVLIAKNGHSALSKLDNISPDLILLDVMMPGMNGFEICEKIQLSDRLQDIPIIFMTALSDPEHKVRGLQAGAVDYITKPFQEEEVLARVGVHMKLRQLNRQLEQRVAERTAELQAALEDLQQAQGQLIHSEKMSALGEMVAGIAHEINNPVSFISGNLPIANNYVQDFCQIFQIYQDIIPSPPVEIQEVLEELEFDFIIEDLPKMLDSMQVGCDRLKQIVLSLSTFSRQDLRQPKPTDLHVGIDATITILGNRLKAKTERPAIQIIRQYGNLPPVLCYGGQLNQVFMNILANAIDALDESNLERSYDEIADNPNQITIQTQFNPDKEWVRVTIEDNGIGMSAEVQQKVFDRLFTTKGVGKGTGLGMAISRQIIEEKHSGVLRCTSVPGEGTQFTVEIPLALSIATPSSH